MKKCNILTDGSIVYQGESGFSRSRNTFIEAPKFYFKRSVSGSTVDILGKPLSYCTPYNHSYGETGNGFFTRLGFDPARPWATFTCALGASPTSHYCAEWSTFCKERSALVFGGGWDHFYCNSIFCMRSISWNGGNWLYGYRAMK